MPSATNPWAARLGAICYAIWGLLHILAAASAFRLGAAQPVGLVQGRLLQGGWNLLLLALLALVVAVALNWRNSWRGYWLNLVVVSVSDIGFVVFLLLPGHSRELVGPAFWILGAVFSTVAILKAPRTP